MNPTRVARDQARRVGWQRPGRDVPTLLAFLGTFGACARASDPELFFAEEGEAAALEVCRGCAVAPACLSLAVEQDWTDGVWGGLTPEQREDYRADLPYVARGPAQDDSDGGRGGHGCSEAPDLAWLDRDQPDRFPDAEAA